MSDQPIPPTQPIEPPTFATTGPNTGLAIAAMVCGIAGLLICMPAGIAGIIMGIIALGRTKREPHLYAGKGMAIAGIVTGAIACVLFPLLLAAILVPALTAPRSAGQDARIQIAMAHVGRTGYIANAIQKFRFDTGVLPKKLADLVSREAPGYLKIKPDQWQGPYIPDPNSLKDPWENDYQYRRTADTDIGYTLRSNGPDGKANTKDDITNSPKRM